MPAPRTRARLGSPAELRLEAARLRQMAREFATDEQFYTWLQEIAAEMDAQAGRI